MAIAAVRAASNGFDGGTSQTLAIDGSGGDCLLVFTGWRRSAGQDLTGITYNGVAMSSVYNVIDGTLFGSGFSCFRLVAPASGSNNIVASYSGTLTGSALLAALLSGVDQTTPIDTSATAGDSAGASTVTVNVSSAAGRLVVGCGVFRGGTATTPTIGAGQTNIDTEPGFGADPDYFAMACSSEPGAGTVTFSYTYAPTGTYNAGVGAVSLNAAAGAAGQPTARRPGRSRPTEIGRGGTNMFRRHDSGLLVPAWSI